LTHLQSVLLVEDFSSARACCEMPFRVCVFSEGVCARDVVGADLRAARGG